MNVLLVDDHFCAREGVACLLKQIIPELQVFEAESFDEGLTVAQQTPLNLVMLDVQLPGKDGLVGLAELKQAFPDLCVVMFSGLDDRELVFQALRLGAMGFIVKSVARQVFVDALRDVLAGKVYLPASAVGPQRTVDSYAGDVTDIPKVSDSACLGLTAREFEVLTWLVQGIGNKQIAKQLGIEEQTVRNHLRPIYQKFGVAKRTELLVKVFERGIVFGKPGVGN
ncbi:response regulator [Methylomonas fluvii]|uniref:Response regulator transcription factor n=1 Tax=Methylomonas fluvii TaxID=1854564 RepID=A0ABR9DHM6_9GAMM|nr:response regulator transcription factor [Methylomonas fluvii]MBD9362609.1 response regulator transcription factor [Methylomonas fluvii]